MNVLDEKVTRHLDVELDLFAGSRKPVRSRLYVFCYVGGKWAIEYRFTHPKTEDGNQEIQDFIQNWRWYGAGV